MSDAPSGIAIIGMSCIFPGASTFSRYWHNLYHGLCHISHFSNEELIAAGIPRETLEANYVKAKGIIEGADVFAPEFFKMTPMEAKITDPQDRLLLQGAWDVLNQAGYQEEPKGSRVGVFTAKSALADYFYKHVLTQPDLVNQFGDYRLHLSTAPDYLSTRISYKLNLTGPSMTLQSACSSSLSATVSACQNLIDDQCDMAIVGAASLTFPFKQGYPYQRGSIMSANGICRPFSDRADGTVPGDGVGLVLLKRAEDAYEDGDPVHAVIRGYGLNNDGARKAGYTAPSSQGQADAILDALHMANFSPETVEYIETHGTGTALGDPIEMVGLHQAFGHVSDAQFCALGAVKANIGHLGAASGMASLIKVALALSQKQIPPLIHFNKPNAEIQMDDSPFYFNTNLHQWTKKPHSRRAGISCFGVGGTNIHLMLEEAPGRVTPKRRTPPCYNLILSARNKADLEPMKQRLQEYLITFTDTNLADVAYTLQQKRPTYPYRTCLTIGDRKDIECPTRINSATEVLSETTPTLVFMFPGQGNQYPFMGKNFYDNYPVFKESYECCRQLYQNIFGEDLSSHLYVDSSKSLLNQTVYSQPLLFAIEYSLACLLKSWGVQPSAVIGHSLGEYVAATVGGILQLKDAIYLVGWRGKLMQNLPMGGMLACFAAPDKLRKLLPPDCEIAAENSPHQCVVSGLTDAIDILAAALAEREIPHRKLSCDKAFHSSAVTSINDAFAIHLLNVPFEAPKIDHISNLNGDYLKVAPNAEYWVRQAHQPVAFSEGIKTLLRRDNLCFVEVGPGNTLSTLVRQHEQDRRTLSCIPLMTHHLGQPDEIRAFHRGLGSLWQQGYTVNWKDSQNIGVSLPLPGYIPLGGKYFIEAGPQTQKVEPVTPPLTNESTNETAIITEIWQRYLGYDHIKTDTDFYELGGDSMAAISVIEAINQAIGTKLYPHHLLQASTIDQLTALLGAEDNSQPFCLVTLNEGEKGIVPLFLMHAIGGGVQYFKDLATYLPKNQPVYGLQAQGLDGHTDPNISLTAMAARYLKIIRTVQPQGAYLLGGHSFGGLLAYEIACSLKSIGETVDLLCLMDTPGFDQMPKRLYDDVEILTSMALLFADDQQQIAIDEAELRSLPPKERLETFIDRIDNPYLKFMTHNDLALLLTLFKANSNAMFNYTPSVVTNDLKITFLKAQVRDEITADNPEKGWLRNMGVNRVNLHMVPGTHHTMMEKPHVQVVAEILCNLIYARSDTA